MQCAYANCDVVRMPITIMSQLKHNDRKLISMPHNLMQTVSAERAVWAMRAGIAVRPYNEFVYEVIAYRCVDKRLIALNFNQ